MKTRYCNNVEKIENYESAKKDNFKGWVCHHRLETHTSEGDKRLVDISREELMALDMYYHRPPEELIFMITRDHLRLHRKGNPGPNRGKYFSEDHKRKIAESNRGKKYFKGLYCVDLYDEDKNLKKEEVIKGVSMRDLWNGLSELAGESTQLDCSSAVAFQNKFRKGRDVKLTNNETNVTLHARIRELKSL